MNRSTGSLARGAHATVKSEEREAKRNKITPDPRNHHLKLAFTKNTTTCNVSKIRIFQKTSGADSTSNNNITCSFPLFFHMLNKSDGTKK